MSHVFQRRSCAYSVTYIKFLPEKPDSVRSSRRRSTDSTQSTQASASELPEDGYLPFEERVYRESASRPLETDAFGPRKRLYLPARTSSSAISRSLNFCTFMDGVIGKSSTKKTRLGTL